MSAITLEISGPKGTKRACSVFMYLRSWSLFRLIAVLHVTSRWPCWRSRTEAFLSSGNQTLFWCKFSSKKICYIDFHVTWLQKPRLGHSRVASGLFFKARLSAKPLIWKRFFYSHAGKTHFHKKVFVLSLVLKGRVFGTRKWPVN